MMVILEQPECLFNDDGCHHHTNAAVAVLCNAQENSLYENANFKICLLMLYHLERCLRYTHSTLQA